jgi:hypothetical protein
LLPFVFAEYRAAHDRPSVIHRPTHARGRTMHTRLCRLLRVRGRWRPFLVGFIYYLTAVVLVENVIIAWNTAVRYRATTDLELGDSMYGDGVDHAMEATLQRNSSAAGLRMASVEPESVTSALTSVADNKSLPLPPAASSSLNPGEMSLNPGETLLKPDETSKSTTVRRSDQPSLNYMDIQEQAFYRRRSERVNPFRHSVRLAPPGVCHNDTRLLVLVHSHPKYRDRRMAIRKTWGSAIRTGVWPNDRGPTSVSTAGVDGDGRQSKLVQTCCEGMQMAFVIGRHVDPGINDAIEEEFLSHWDIIQGDFTDDYQNMTLKSLLDLRFAVDHCPLVKYVLKTDDDMVINLPYLVDVLDNIAVNTSRFVVGPLNVGSRVYRTGKWKLSKEEFPFETFPPYESGSAYVISGDVIGDLFNAAEYVPPIFIDDVYITGILGRIVGIHHVRRPGFAFWTSQPPTACDLINRRIVTGTKMSPNGLFGLWDELVRGPQCTVGAWSIVLYCTTGGGRR